MSTIETFKLKPISGEAIAAAIKKAEHYRLLNEPGQAESICRDVLRIDPENQKALITTVLALTDQFTAHGYSPGARTARDYAAQISDEYLRLYFTALICERQARALLTKGMAGSFAYEGFREAMDGYEKAEKISPAGHDDSILRWNSCVRTIRQTNIRPRDEEDELPLE